MRHKFLTALLITFVLFCGNVFAQDTSVEKEIGDEIVEFMIPEDYETLKEAYLAVIDVYVEAENHNIDQKKVIDKYDKTVSDITKSNEELKEKLKQYEKSVDTYIKYKNKCAIYFGGTGGLNLSIAGDKIITMGPTLDFVKPGWSIGFTVPLAFTVTTVPSIDFSVGAGIRFLKRLNY